jgi:hypothetical protein
VLCAFDLIELDGEDLRRAPIEHTSFGLDRVLERLAIVVEKQPDGKMRATSQSWEHERVLFPTEVLEVRCVNGRLHVSRKVRKPDEWDPPVEVYDPYGPRAKHEEVEDLQIGMVLGLITTYPPNWYLVKSG